jgi:YD repeat-containing protein
MKNTTLLLLYCLTLHASFAQQDQNVNDWEKEGLKGQVRSYHERYYEAVLAGDSVVRGEAKRSNNRYYFSPTRYYAFNQDGFITEFINRYGTHYKKYDANNRILESSSLDTNAALVRKVLYCYSKKGLLTTMEWYDGTGKKEATSTFKYDKAGHVLYEKEKDAYDTYIDKYTYDKKGYLIEETSLENKEVWYTASYKNDSLGRKVEIQYSEPDKHKSTTINTYNALGNLITQNYKRLDTLETRSTRFAYQENNILLSVITETNELKEIEHYDEKGNLVLHAVYELDGKLRDEMKHQYIYDQTGNWIQQITFMNDTPIEVIVRLIEYYPEVEKLLSK